MSYRRCSLPFSGKPKIAHLQVLVNQATRDLCQPQCVLQTAVHGLCMFEKQAPCPNVGRKIRSSRHNKERQYCGHIVVALGVGFGLELVVVSPCKTIEHSVRAS